MQERNVRSGVSLAARVVAALLSDIFDGVLARRWHCDTPAVRLFDSLADTFFYLCAAVALWLRQPVLWHTYAAPLVALLGSEAARFAFDFCKFGKPASYHSWLAKTWGLLMAIAVILVFAKGWSYPLVPLALWAGIFCNLEGLVMSVVLPIWRKDVNSLYVAWRLRQQLHPAITAEAFTPRAKRSWLRKSIAFGVACAMTLPLYAVEAGQVAYVSGTSLTIAKDTPGTLDTTSPTALVFRTTGSGTAIELAIPYKEVTSFQYSSEVAHHIGVLPAIAVGLVRRRERKHFFSIAYHDASGTPQVAVFEVPKHDPRGLLAILRARAPQACKAVASCGGFIEQ